MIVTRIKWTDNMQICFNPKIYIRSGKKVNIKMEIIQPTLAPSEGDAHRAGSVNSDTNSSATSLYEVVPFAFTFSQTFMEKWRNPFPPFSLFLRLLKVEKSGNETQTEGKGIKTTRWLMDKSHP